MHGIYLVQPSEAIENLFEESGGLILGQSLFLVKVAFQIPPIAILHRYELSPFGAPSINIPDYILVMALLEYSNLGSDKFLQFGCVNHEFSGNGFDRNSVIGILVEGFVDYSPGSFS